MPRLSLAESAVAPDDPHSPTPGAPALSSRVRRGAAWDASRTLVVRVTNIFITAIVARILTQHDFGVFAVALTAYMLVNTFAKGGAGACLMRADFDIDALAPTMLSVSLITASTCAALTAIFARSIATALGSADGEGPVRVMALVLFLEGFSAIPWTQLSRDFRQDRQFLANIISFVPAQVVLIVLAKSGYGALAFAWSTVVNQAITAVLLIIFAPTKYLPGFSRAALSPLFRFGIPLAGSDFVNYILLNVDYAFIGHLIGTVQLGLYMLAFSVASWPIGLIGGAVTAVSMPAFSRIKHDPELLKKSVLGAVGAASAIIMPVCGFMVVLARPVVLLLYGARWSASAEVLSILSLYSACSILCTFFGTILSSLGKPKALVTIQLLWLVALLPAMALGVHYDGIIGAARAHIGVIGLIVLPTYLLVLRRATGVRLGALVRAVLPALVVASAAAFVARTVAAQLSSPLLQLAGGLAAGGLVYLFVAGRQLQQLLGDGVLGRLRAVRAFRLYESAIRLVSLPTPHDRYRGRHAVNSAGRALSGRPPEGELGGNQQPGPLPLKASWADASGDPTAAPTLHT